MMSLKKSAGRLALVLTIVLAPAAAIAQSFQPLDYRGSASGSWHNQIGNCANGQCTVPGPGSSWDQRNPGYRPSERPQSPWQQNGVERGNGEFIPLPTDLTRNDRSRSGGHSWDTARPLFDRPTESRRNDWVLPASYRGLEQRRYEERLDRPAWGSEAADSFQSRRRIPYGTPDVAQQNWFRELDSRLPLRGNGSSSFDLRRPATPSGGDPFTPGAVPLPNRNSDMDAAAARIDARYANPTTVRAVQAMSPDQCLQLYREVSQRIDQRHLEPTSYDLRVRRGLQNVWLALDSAAFRSANGIGTGSFQLDGLRNQLSRLSDSMEIRDYSDSEQFLRSLMQQSASIPGLSPSAVGFEFLSAAVEGLDKFSALEPADPRNRFGADAGSEEKTAVLEDSMVGVGIELKEHQDGLLITRTLRSSPADRAGLEAGDVILAIDNRRLAGQPMSAGVELLKGSAGSRVNLRVYREGRGERDFTVTRSEFRIWSVNDVRMLPGSTTGYFSLSRFAQNSTAEVDQALTELHRQGMKSLVIDLRGNPGGLLNVCVDITNRFLPCGTIVSTKGRLNEDNMLEQASYTRTWSTPLVVLIDSDSASASEIFAAAIQDNRRGVVVGERSYGKGTVQTHFPLSSVAGNLRLTTARFYSPNGRPMSGQGVTPDVPVRDADGIVGGDDVLIRAAGLAVSPQLAELAKAAGSCRTNKQPLPRNSMRTDIIDPLPKRTVLR